MAILLSPVLNEQQFDSNGDPLAGGFIYTYLAGTTTPVTTYKTSTGTAHSNPIVLDSAGYYPNGTQLWLDSGQSYKFEVQNSSGAIVRTYDDITPINNDPGANVDQWVIYNSSSITYISATSLSVGGDQTAIFQIGRRLKSNNTGGTVYSTITNSVYGAPNTTITVINDTGTALDSGLDAVSYGILSPFNPSVTAITANTSSTALTVNQLGSGSAFAANGNTVLGNLSTNLHTVNGGLSITRTSVTSPVSTDGNVFSGTYTPTLTGVLNVAGSTPNVCQYMRVGDVVTVSGGIAIDPIAAAGASTQLDISLPIASNLSTGNQLGGTAAVTSLSMFGAIIGEPTNNRASLVFASQDGANRNWSFHFTYLIVP